MYKPHAHVYAQAALARSIIVCVIVESASAIPVVTRLLQQLSRAQTFALVLSYRAGLAQDHWKRLGTRQLQQVLLTIEIVEK
jgi:hypothetical protein